MIDLSHLRHTAKDDIFKLDARHYWIGLGLMVASMAASVAFMYVLHLWILPSSFVCIKCNSVDIKINIYVYVLKLYRIRYFLLSTFLHEFNALWQLMGDDHHDTSNSYTPGAAMPSPSLSLSPPQHTILFMHGIHAPSLYYWGMLVPLLVLPTGIALYLNWFSMQVFEHN